MLTGLGMLAPKSFRHLPMFLSISLILFKMIHFVKKRNVNLTSMYIQMYNRNF